MIIVKLKGGIGNQLFQFAFGRALALYRADELYFDLSLLTEDIPNTTPRPFKLKYLTNYKFFENNSIDSFNEIVKRKKAIQIDDNFSKDQLDAFINDVEIEAIYLDGYFQNEFYFYPFLDHIKNEINALLDFHYQLSGINDNKIISSTQPTVSIHIRRTDYLKPSTLRVHGICEFNYYQEALAILRSKLSYPHFYLFSDDELIAEQMFSTMNEKTNISSFINNLMVQDKDLVELALISKCGHFIIANSSYSWWGSYLSKQIDKIIIAPRQWYKHPGFSQQSEDIALASWIRI